MENRIGKFEAARRASGLTAEKACLICEFTRPTLTEREQNPDGWRLGELRKLKNSMTPDGVEMLKSAVLDHIFLG